MKQNETFRFGNNVLWKTSTLRCQKKKKAQCFKLYYFGNYNYAIK